MYQIIKDNQILNMTDSLTYICKQANGCFGMCKEKDAQGIALGGVPYHLLGKPELEGSAGTVMAIKIDSGAKLLAVSLNISSIEDALCEMDAANAANIATIENALCEIDMGGTSNE